jgi:phosphate:Na+ symporter
MMSTLHALDHTARLAEILTEGGLLKASKGAARDGRLTELGVNAMRAAGEIGNSITSEGALSPKAPPIGWKVSSEIATALTEIHDAASELDALQRDYRATTIGAVASGELTAADAFTLMETARRLDVIVHHAWQASAHLLGHGDAP